MLLNPLHPPLLNTHAPRSVPSAEGDRPANRRDVGAAMPATRIGATFARSYTGRILDDRHKFAFSTE